MVRSLPRSLLRGFRRLDLLLRKGLDDLLLRAGEIDGRLGRELSLRGGEIRARRRRDASLAEERRREVQRRQTETSGFAPLVDVHRRARSAGEQLAHRVHAPVRHREVQRRAGSVVLVDVVRVGVQYLFEEVNVAHRGGAVKRSRRVGRLHSGRVTDSTIHRVVPTRFIRDGRERLVVLSVVPSVVPDESSALSHGRLALPRAQPRRESRVTRQSGVIRRGEPLVVRR